MKTTKTSTGAVPADVGNAETVPAPVAPKHLHHRVAHAIRLLGRVVPDLIRYGPSIALDVAPLFIPLPFFAGTMKDVAADKADKVAEEVEGELGDLADNLDGVARAAEKDVAQTAMRIGNAFYFGQDQERRFQCATLPSLSPASPAKLVFNYTTEEWRERQRLHGQQHAPPIRHVSMPSGPQTPGSRLLVQPSRVRNHAAHAPDRIHHRGRDTTRPNPAHGRRKHYQHSVTLPVGRSGPSR